MRQDQRRLEAVREVRRRQAERFFDARADAWDQERTLAIDPAVVEAALRELFAQERPANLLDIGTGTGRILQVLAGQVGFGLGIDLSHDMLAVARANLDQREARNCQVRHGDMYQLPLPDASFAAATLHQVLHYADDPLAALAEAARVLAPGRLAGRGRSCRARGWSGCASRAATAGSASATRRSAAGSRSSA